MRTDRNKKEIEQFKKYKRLRTRKVSFILKVKSERDARNFIIAVAVGLLLIVIVLLINRFVIKSRTNTKSLEKLMMNYQN
jgi:multisubunit Na+/H+ antiporter MnhB subunit